MHLTEINLRDPFILPHEGVYYLTGTRAETCWGPADGFDVYTSRDLENWTGPTALFQNDGSFWADRNYWAPEIHPWRGSFYLFASFKAEGVHRGTAILRAEKPEGPYAPWSDGPVTPGEWECLDGTFFVEADGSPWMVFCHEWVQCGDGTVCAIPLREDLRQAAGEPRVLFHASEAKWSKKILHSSGMEGYVTDGPFLWREEQENLLCLWAGMSEKGYTQGLAESASGRLTGPWRQRPPIFDEDGGHGMLFRSFDGKLYLTLHRPNQHLQEHPVLISLPIDKTGRKDKI